MNLHTLHTDELYKESYMMYMSAASNKKTLGDGDREPRTRPSLPPTRPHPRCTSPCCSRRLHCLRPTTFAADAPPATPLLATHLLPVVGLGELLRAAGTAVAVAVAWGPAYAVQGTGAATSPQRVITPTPAPPHRAPRGRLLGLGRARRRWPPAALGSAALQAGQPGIRTPAPTLRAPRVCSPSWPPGP